MPSSLSPTSCTALALTANIIITRKLSDVVFSLRGLRWTPRQPGGAGFSENALLDAALCLNARAYQVTGTNQSKLEVPNEPEWNWLRPGDWFGAGFGGVRDMRDIWQRSSAASGEFAPNITRSPCPSVLERGCSTGFATPPIPQSSRVDLS
jgi:hypothetical protein